MAMGILSHVQDFDSKLAGPNPATGKTQFVHFVPEIIDFLQGAAPVRVHIVETNLSPQDGEIAVNPEPADILPPSGIQAGFRMSSIMISSYR